MSIDDILTLSPVIPVVTLPGAGVAPDIARALLRGGVRVIEIVLRTEDALEGIRRVAAEVPEITVGAGTILDLEQLRAAREAGAAFAVSPGLTPGLAGAATVLPLLPGAVTCSEVMTARERGFRALKFFPAELNAGVDTLGQYARLFPDVRFCPTGGITAKRAPDYLALPNVPCVGGSWLVPASLVAAGDWDGISRLARQATG